MLLALQDEGERLGIADISDTFSVSRNHLKKVVITPAAWAWLTLYVAVVAASV